MEQGIDGISGRLHEISGLASVLSRAAVQSAAIQETSSFLNGCTHAQTLRHDVPGSFHNNLFRGKDSRAALSYFASATAACTLSSLANDREYLPTQSPRWAPDEVAAVRDTALKLIQPH